jgi:transposase
MDQWSEIRRRVLTEGLSKREACAHYGVHWKTLEKMLTHVEPPGYRQRQARAKPRLDPFLPAIQAMLESDRSAPPKQRHTARRIFLRLQEEHGYTGCESIVRAAVATWRLRQAEVFVPLSQPPGEAQVDFGEAEVVVAGKQTTASFFVLTLPYSDAFFCCAFPRECTETFQEGHVRAFEHFGGVPPRISYDNSKIAAATIVHGRGGAPTREFLRLMSHFLFTHHFCRVRRANEKGHVERMVGFARSNFLVPVPHASSWEELNRVLVERCRADLARRLRGQAGSKQELLDQERAELLPLPAQRFEARRVVPTQANSLALVRFDGNDYSVPTAYAHQAVTAVGGIDEVRLVCRDHVVARHRRHWGSEHTTFDPVHYLALLERKPGALDYARPLEQWQLPVAFGVLRRRLEAQWGHGGTREYIKVLRLLERASVPELNTAVQAALGLGATTCDVVRVLLEARRERPVGLFCLDGRPHLSGVAVPAPDLTAYRALQPTRDDAAVAVIGGGA